MNISIEELHIANIAIDVVRKNIKNMHLAVYPPTGRVRLAVPSHTPDSKLRLFAIKKLGWIKKNVEIMEKQEREQPREYVNRESHYLFGRRYLLKVVDSNHKKVLKTRKSIELYFPNFPNLPKEAIVKQKELVMREWYRNELKELVPGMIAKWEKLLGVECKGWSTRFMRTKWGSCNSDKQTILLNVELAKKPKKCIDYVVLHELIHIKERKHNANFVQYLDHYLPGWEYVREELNETIT